jgi:hypothetical protein
MDSDLTPSRPTASEHEASASTPVSHSDSASRKALDCLREARPLLLQLHKTLMEAARLSYESNYGPILSKGDYFRLVVSNDWFQWLRPFSQLIVRIDERLATKKLDEAEQAEVILRDAQTLLSPVSQGGPEHPYYELMQQNPEIAMFHAQITRILGSVEAAEPSDV